MEQPIIHLIPLTPHELEKLMQGIDNIRLLLQRFDAAQKISEKDPTSALLTIAETAKRLHLSPRTIRSYIKARAFTYVCLGNRKLIPTAEVEQFIKDRHYKPIGQ